MFAVLGYYPCLDLFKGKPGIKPLAGINRFLDAKVAVRCVICKRTVRGEKTF